MDDVFSKIQDVLSDEKSMEQIKNLASMLGLDENTPPPDFLNQNNSQTENSDEKSSNDFDFSKIFVVKELLDKANQKDNSVDLIVALKPFLKEENQIKADKVIAILRILNVLPLLKESGILGGDLFGLL